MASLSNSQADLDALTEQWLTSQSWPRRVSARLGLQGRLILCLVLMLSLAVGASCWMFATQSSARVADIMGEQARQLSTAVAQASEDEIRNGDVEQLSRMAQDLVKSRNIMFVAFFDADFKPIALASRDPDLRGEDLGLGPRRVEAMMQARRGASAVFGDYLEVVAPALTNPTLKQDKPSGPRLVGYVAVGVSQVAEARQLRNVNYGVIAIGLVLVILSLPLGFLLVRRVFQPIRHLVAATRRITAGDLETRVAIHRPDVIGELARSFNEMVTRVKSQQEALAQANRDLESKVEQRTAQLAMANKRLSSEIAEKEDFLRAVSHDLNAPLRNISGMASMLLMKHHEKFDQDIIHRLERIQKNVEAETDLITELLELSRIKTRRQKMEDVPIEPVIVELCDLFENDLKSQGIGLVIDTPMPALHCERARVRQVFQNLIDNAIKYMGDGPVKEIHIGCDVKPTEAEFYVRDTGIGIDANDLNKVFYVFRRGKNTAAQNVAGKGVGLASVKSIIETYNGTIWVESRPGEGCTLRFTINGSHVREQLAPLAGPASESHQPAMA